MWPHVSKAANSKNTYALLLEQHDLISDNRSLAHQELRQFFTDTFLEH